MKNIIMKEAIKDKKQISQTNDSSSIKYFNEAEIKCSCGAVYKVGSTQKSGNVEVCSACHPFYTGTQKFIDSAGRLEKFKARMKAGEAFKSKKSR